MPPRSTSRPLPLFTWPPLAGSSSWCRSVSLPLPPPLPLSLPLLLPLPLPLTTSVPVPVPEPATGLVGCCLVGDLLRATGLAVVTGGGGRTEDTFKRFLVTRGLRVQMDMGLGPSVEERVQRMERTDRCVWVWVCGTLLAVSSIISGEVINETPNLPSALFQPMCVFVRPGYQKVVETQAGSSES